MDVLTLSEADATRLTREGINRIPTGGAFRTGDEVVVCKMGLVVLHAAWDGECLCQDANCATVGQLPAKRKLSRPASATPESPAPNRRIRISKPPYVPPVSAAQVLTANRTPPAASPLPATSRASRNALAGWLLTAAAAVVGGGGVWWFLGPAPDPPYAITKFTKPISERVLPIGLHIRYGPGAGYPVKNISLSKGDQVTGIGQATAQDGGTWQYVRAKGRTFGYVNARLLAEH